MPQLCAARGAQLTAPIPTAAPGQHRTFMGWEGGGGRGVTATLEKHNPRSESAYTRG